MKFQFTNNIYLCFYFLNVYCITYRKKEKLINFVINKSKQFYKNEEWAEWGGNEEIVIYLHEYDLFI